MATDLTWLDEQISKFKVERPIYEKYKSILELALNRARKERSTLGIVQARAKTLPSFAEKCLRKAHKYDDPVTQLTDLCGARVITDTQEETQQFCEFIRETFIIDETNSLDVFERLKEEEFGYRSVHFVVQLDEKKMSAFLDIDSDDEIQALQSIQEIGDRKAEIQVRTFLQHAWADVSHDRLYKTQIKVPDVWKRELHRSAALLESVDGAFSRAVDGLNAYQLNYSAYMSDEQMAKELGMLTAVLKYDNKNLRLRHQIARLAIAMEDWETTISITKDYPEAADLLHDYGLALFKNEEMEAARAVLQTAIEKNPQNAETHCDLGETWFGVDDKIALKHFHEAFQLDGNDPRYLRRFLECSIHVDRSIKFLTLLRPSIEAAIAMCRERIAVGIYVPEAFYDIGLFALIQGKPSDSLKAYAKAVQLSHSERPIEDALRSLVLLDENIDNPPKELKNGLDWVQNFLRVACLTKLYELECKFENREADEAKCERIREKIIEHKQDLNTFQTAPGIIENEPQAKNKTFVLVAGGCSEEFEKDLDAFRASMQVAFQDFNGTIICGGTNAGISGIVGDLQLPESAEKIGYMPYNTPPDAIAHDAYKIVRTPDTTGFTPRESIQTWIDLLANGYKPKQIKLFGVNGGEISACEFRMALAFGAQVGILQDSGRAAAKIIKDADWQDTVNLLPLPLDAMSLRAFVQPVKTDQMEEFLEKAGRAVHEKYVSEIEDKSVAASLKPWDQLHPDFKDSSRQQVAYAAEILHKAGFGVRPAKKIKLPVFSEKEIEFMAEMEHGRWTVERLGKGWRYDTKKDVQNKKSPFLIPWAELPEEIKRYDRKAVANLPQVLAEVDFEVYRE